MKQLLDIVSEYVSIGTVYADAAFDSIGVMHAVEEADFAHHICKSSGNRVGRFVDDIDHDVAVKQTHEMEKTSREEKVTVTRHSSGSPRIARRMQRCRS